MQHRPGLNPENKKRQIEIIGYYSLKK